MIAHDEAAARMSLMFNTTIRATNYYVNPTNPKIHDVWFYSDRPLTEADIEQLRSNDETPLPCGWCLGDGDDWYAASIIHENMFRVWVRDIYC